MLPGRIRDRRGSDRLLCQDQTIANEGSSGAALSIWGYYDFVSGQLQLKEGIFTDGDKHPENPYFYTTTTFYEDYSNPISEEEAENIINKYTYETISNPSTTVLVTYMVDASGKIRVDVHYNGAKGLPELPVFGMRFIMPTLADKYIYKGLSGETYPDRKAGAEKGIYEVTDLSLTPYLVPQECGMRMDTEWLEISRHTSLDNSRTDHSPQTLRIEKMDREFAFSCLPYTASEIENALHHEELPPARRTVLCVYGAVRGVGGIDSWGTDVADEYHVSAEEDIRYSFTIC